LRARGRAHAAGQSLPVRGHAGHPAGAREDSRRDGRAGAVLFRGAGDVRRQGGAEAPDRRGRTAPGAPDRAARRPLGVHDGGDRARRARAHRRARSQAGRSRAARAPCGDGPHGVAADLRRSRPARIRREPGAPAPRARIRGADGLRLVLARHGQSVWNQVRKFQGANDVGLSELGRAQAEALGRALRAGFRITAAYVSPMCRALDTAEIALAGTGIPLVPIPDLRELSLGEWEGCTVDEVRARDGNPYHAWVRSPLDCPPPGGEPLPDVCGRVQKAIGQIGASHANGDDILVVAHGGVISVYLCHLLGISFNSLWRMRIDNCSLTIACPPRLASINDPAHRPNTPNTAWFDVAGERGGRRSRRDATGRGTRAMMVLVSLFGGTALLLYGIRLSGEAFQRALGGRLRNLLTNMSRRRLLAVLSGATITAIIQSSAATTLM